MVDFSTGKELPFTDKGLSVSIGVKALINIHPKMLVGSVATTTPVSEFLRLLSVTNAHAFQ